MLIELSQALGGADIGPVPEPEFGADLAAVMPTITVEGVTGTMTWSADGNTNKAASAILYKNGVGTLFGQDNANDAAGAESGDAADTAADAEA